MLYVYQTAILPLEFATSCCLWATYINRSSVLLVDFLMWPCLAGCCLYPFREVPFGAELSLPEGHMLSEGFSWERAYTNAFNGDLWPHSFPPNDTIASDSGSHFMVWNGPDLAVWSGCFLWSLIRHRSPLAKSGYHYFHMYTFTMGRSGNKPDIYAAHPEQANFLTGP